MGMYCCQNMVRNKVRGEVTRKGISKFAAHVLFLLQK